MPEKYISASYLMDALGVFNDRVNGNAHFLNGIDTAKEIVESAPAADVQHIVHGRWVYEGPNGANSFKGSYWCDQCHQPEPFKRSFCPECGADMRNG